MSALKLLSRRYNKAVLAIALAILTAITVFVPGAIAQRQIGPYLVAKSDWVTIGAKQTGSLYWQCSDDRYPLSAGFETEAVGGNPSAGFKIIHSYPDYRTWNLRLRNSDDIDRNVKMYTICGQL
ncbi:MAG: hypothetical protein AAFQ89_11045 [Cyanobacteria bacterium J06626_18]